MTDPSAPINACSLYAFVGQWAAANGILLEAIPPENEAMPKVLHELRSLHILTLEDLAAIIPGNYVQAFREYAQSTNLFGMVRDWLLIKDARALSPLADWTLYHNDLEWLSAFLPPREIAYINDHFDID